LGPQHDNRPLEVTDNGVGVCVLVILLTLLGDKFNAVAIFLMLIPCLLSSITCASITVSAGSLEEAPAHANGCWNAGSSPRDPAGTKKSLKQIKPPDYQEAVIGFS